MALKQGICDCLYVLAGVAALWDILSAKARQDAAGKCVHLGAEVVDVVLGGHICPCGSQDARQSVADGGPAGVSQVERAGRVG